MLIPARGNYEVVYTGTDNEGKPYTFAGPTVEAWDEDGVPWIVNEEFKKARRLTPANSASNYSHVAQTDGPVIAAVPGSEWQYQCTGEGWDQPSPILAWLVRADGSVYPVAPDSDGYVDDCTTAGNFKKITHPAWEEDSTAGA